MLSEEFQITGLLLVSVTESKHFHLNGYMLNLADVKCEMPQGFIRRCLLFIIYLYDSHLGVKYSELHHFADDTEAALQRCS